MSHAYCLSCNEMVPVTVSGTCPVGHPVSDDESASPEPWVGFAGTTDRAAAVNGNGHRAGGIDLAAQPRVDAAPAVSTPPTANGFDHGPASDAEPPETSGGDGAGDELAALLAQALAEEQGAGISSTTADAEPPTAADALAGTDQPAEPDPVGEPGPGWDELSTLAAELELGRGADEPEDPPVAPAPPEASATDADLSDLDGLVSEAAAAYDDPADTQADDPLFTPPTPDVEPAPARTEDHAADDAGDVDSGLLADLESFLATEADASAAPSEAAEVAPVADEPTPEPAAEPLSEPVDELMDVYATPTDDVPSVPSSDDLPPPAPASAAPTAPPPPAEESLDPEEVWAPAEPEPAPQADGPALDPLNFTARGAKVGADGNTKKKRRWKR